MHPTVEPGISVVIPTYGRNQVLVDTLKALLDLPAPANELLVVDQTEKHDADTERQLRQWHDKGEIRWLRLAEPSIPRAMNLGLLEAAGPLVLFLDDDIRPDEQLVSAHREAHQAEAGCIVAGRVLQPWHQGGFDPDGRPFGFNSPQSREVTEFMGGNFSLDRDAALAIGGFDENFVRVAYRFEAEFAYRWRQSGRRIRYEPNALIHHLKISSGGTRTFGEHLTTLKPDHSVGAYYFMLRTRRAGALGGMLKRLLGSVKTRHHLRQPWWIPITLVSEIRGMLWAL